MRILLASNAQYFPAHGGGERSNRMLIEALAVRGHECRVVTRIDRFGEDGARKLLAQLSERHIQAERQATSVRFLLNGVTVVAATNPQSFRAFFVAEKDTFRPDVIVASTDDPAQLLLEASLEDETARTVFLARATIALPFGPDAAFASREKTEMLRPVDGILGVSQYVASYIQEHSGMEAVHVPIALPEPGPHPLVGNFDNEFVTLANPCAVKGITIFIALARAFRHLAFAGVPTWGTTAEDLELMRAEPNITLLPKVDRINDLLKRTRVLLMPSLWAEARSRMAVEGMMAGVPTMASDLGGLPEAKMHIPYILPVRRITAYSQQLDAQMVPIANVPEQDCGPWEQALDRLTSDRNHWEELSQLSRKTALHYAATTTVEPFEEYLLQLKRKPRASATANLRSTQLSRLSPQRRKLLELKLRKQGNIAIGNPALPFGGSDPEKFRLFCFPHAGGGAGFFRSWRQDLIGPAEVAPVQYPGHETRRAEAFLLSMRELIDNLFENLDSALEGEFAFFGHSMGAIVAFELGRKLRRLGRTLPLALIASSARAPVFRLNHQPPPDPTRSELLDQVRQLGGLTKDVLEEPKLLEAILPALEADTSLYRRYCYEAAPRLSIPVLALGGERDPNITIAHLDRWKDETSAFAEVKQFAGGHFFLREDEKTVLKTIATFLERVNSPGSLQTPEVH
jgi:surfactin synthase thioesterase subunit/glycosyltransferase involved in cell wall biosynthesis